VAAPPSILPTLAQMDLAAAFTSVALPFVLVFLFIDMFDTMGTLIGVAEQGGLMKEGKLPRAGAAMGSDAIATATGAVLGTSTVTSYIESATGVELGGRTGLVGVVVAIGFLLALLFSPVIAMIGSYPAITAPALVLVGAMMMRNVARIAWDDETEAIPAFLIIAGIPLSFSIGDGIALGFLVYPVIKAFTGRVREVNWVMWTVAALLALYFVFLHV
jgi:AGZA family xanthine/uracil permease-like MFS transporter